MTQQAAKPSLPVSPARNPNSLDDVDCYLAEEDEKEDEEAEGAVRPAGETAAGVKLVIPALSLCSKSRGTTPVNSFLQGRAPEER